jgi:hypothetical protein
MSGGVTDSQILPVQGIIKTPLFVLKNLLKQLKFTGYA